MSPPERRRPAPAKDTGPLVAEVTTSSTASVTDLAEVRERRAARLAWSHLRLRGLDSELVRRTLGVAS